MATRILYNNTGDGDRVLSMSGSQIARQIDIGSGWNWLRLGVRLQLTNSKAVDGNLNIVGPTLAMGLCSGTSSLYGDTNTTYFLGMDTDSSKTFVGSYVGARYYIVTNGQRIITKVNNTTTVYATNVNYSIGMPREDNAQPVNQLRIIHFIDYIKPTVDPGMGQIVFYFTQNAANGVDATTSSFYPRMSENTASLLTGYTSSHYIIPYSESVYGNLNTVNINWGNIYGLEISDVSVYRFQ